MPSKEWLVAKERSPIADYAVYLVVRFTVCILQMLSWQSAKHVAHFLAWIVYQVDARHRRVALDNLRHAFPSRYTDTELNQMVRAVFRHFCTVVIEMVLMPRKLHIKNHKKHLMIVNHEPML